MNLGLWSLFPIKGQFSFYNILSAAHVAVTSTIWCLELLLFGVVSDGSDDDDSNDGTSHSRL